MAFSLGEYQDIFLEEADEQLQELNQNLLELEKNPDDHDIINNIFRAAHSLKSSAAFVGLNDLSDLAHKMENLLQGIRDGSLQVTTSTVDVIFKCFDAISGVIDKVASGEAPDQDLTWIIEEIQAVSETSRSGEAVRKPAENAGYSEAEIPKTVMDSSDRRKIKKGLEEGRRCMEITVFMDETAQMKWVKAQLVLNNLAKIGQVVTTIPGSENLSDDSMGNVFKVIFITEYPLEQVRYSCDIDLVNRIDIRSISLGQKDDKVILKFGDVDTYHASVDTSDLPSEYEEDIDFDEDEDLIESEYDIEDEETEEQLNARYLEKAMASKGVTREKDEQEKKKITVLKTVKVSIDKLDQLLNNVGELVIANSGFYKLYEELRAASENKGFINEFKSRMEQMSRIAKDLQTGIMKTRMVPIGSVFQRFNRLVRDLAREFQKEVQLVIKGEDTELDKKVIDSIGEPLLHLIRNAIDHGIEPVEERKRLGKSETAIVTLNAYQGGNQIFVEVSDDGRGLNLEQIKRKVIELNMATPEMIAAMDNTDIYNYIFNPGFSTAKKITDISGRGVGMNVVKEIVNELNGSVGIETEAGMGTNFMLAFPITLAIIPAIMTRVQKEMFAIPLSDVIETIKISNTDITTIEGHEVINLRGEILSLLRLNHFIGLKSALSPDTKVPVVVVGFGNRKIGLMVDYLEGKLEIVIKSLEQNYRTVEGFAGASILGDGSICLILDISSMMNRVIVEQDKMARLERMKLAEVGQAKYEQVDDLKDIKDARAGKPKEDEREEKISDRAQEPAAPGKETREEAKAPKEEFKEVPLDKIEPPVKPSDEIIKKKDEPAVAPPAGDIKKEEPSAALPPREEIKEEEKPAGKRVPAEAMAKPEEDEVQNQVVGALEDFKKELRDSIKTQVDSGTPSDHMAEKLDITQNDLNEFQIIANIGAANAAESLSKIIDKRIDLSIPMVTIQPVEQIPRYLGHVDSVYIGVMLPVLGDAQGTVLFIFNENTGFELIDLLWGTNINEGRELTPDGESALNELTNIVGSSVINVFAEKSGLVIKPGLPIIVHDYLQSVIDSILVMHNIKNDYAIVMDTAFYYENDKIIGNLLLLPESESLKRIVERLRENVEKN